MNEKWNKINCDGFELNLEITLGGGQAFGWNKIGNNEWQGGLSGLVFTLKQDFQGNLLYFVHNPAISLTTPRRIKNQRKNQTFKEQNHHLLKLQNNDSYYDKILIDYFQMHINLKEQYSVWGASDQNFGTVSKHYPGIRILRQDPVENLISFICSSNNNIARITTMVENLCSNFGEKIWSNGKKQFFAFPTLESLSQDGTEEKLRRLSFGYRAKYIAQAAKFILSNYPPGWLESLRRVPYEEAHAALLKLPGVGAKVADCVCLMSLDKLDAVPVDTHIWQVTRRDYMPHLKNAKSLTNQIYKQIGEFYRTKFGKYAGWASTVLFAADLKQFRKDENVNQKL